MIHVAPKSWTNIALKRLFWPRFARLVSAMLLDAGRGKYALHGNPDKEATDLIVEVYSTSWILGTMMKYLLRYGNEGRERDLLKLVSYAFILWLMHGHHLKLNHDLDTSPRAIPRDPCPSVSIRGSSSPAERKRHARS